MALRGIAREELCTVVQPRGNAPRPVVWALLAPCRPSCYGVLGTRSPAVEVGRVTVRMKKI
jgi:hypothetical protein